MIDPINAPHFQSIRSAAYAASKAAQAETKRRNEEATRVAALRAEAAAIGAELDPESIEQGELHV
ncbi:hypothetical protein AcdelDRAFT_1990 [Acidovorax delafieldii 2AN]|uniref:Uncharacterized protein n=1 Tax=Acidovorax delafieldii 2AN TaxID=573060 RepID=C5T510_ACIDE|nr:hypothetical protein [Acidovorax delafieldii]EER60465.1 hypothetical protein AcdelDRAFT_1990 [Acidovorax delafieldii 2AN]